MGSRDDCSSLLQVDFLCLPFQGEDITRSASEFTLGRPWAIADFGARLLKKGWWRLECDGEGDLRGVEVRLRSAHEPLIVLPAAAAKNWRIFLQANEAHHVSLLVSPWPGRRVFKSLRLVRLGATEVAGLVVGSAGRLLKNPKRFEVISRVMGRLSAGHAVGINAGIHAEDAPPPVSSADLLKGAVREVSVEQLGIKAVTAEGDMLHVDAFTIVAAEFQRMPSVQAIYCDAREAGQILPRPQWDKVLADYLDIAGLPVFFRDTDIDVSSGAAAVVKAIAAKVGSVHRVPLPLVSRDRALRVPVATPPRPVLTKKPLVSMIVPTKQRTQLLAKCLEGLAEATEYSNFEVVVVDNGSDITRIGPLLVEMQKRLSIRRVEWPHEFNFSEIIAAGVRESRGEIVLLLNDDVEPLWPGWLDRIVESVMEPDVGAVGARLIFGDRSIQHAGVMMGLAGACGHLWKGTPEEEAQQNPYIAYPGSRLAVTGACLAVRRELFDFLAGLDAVNFPVSYNDIDFCLRLRKAGYRTVYRGDAVLIHHESQTRGLDHEHPARRQRLVLETQRFLERWGEMIPEDPFGSPAFDLSKESGAVHRAFRTP
jgi:GT2 family glycosyltransferase